MTPVHQTSVWVAIVSPSESRTLSSVASSTVVPSLTSTPRRRSTFMASSPSLRSSSGSTREATSTSTQRTSVGRTRGYSVAARLVISCIWAAVSVPE